jgi:hypothetical protein
MRLAPDLISHGTSKNRESGSLAATANKPTRSVPVCRARAGILVPPRGLLVRRIDLFDASTMLGFSDMPTDFFMPSFHGLFFSFRQPKHRGHEITLSQYHY